MCKKHKKYHCSMSILFKILLYLLTLCVYIAYIKAYFAFGVIILKHKNTAVSDALESSRTIVLAGNPNVGKSTLFNALTGLKQHTGNWTGKTVDCACGVYNCNGKAYLLTDIPGAYSLKVHSQEEQYALESLISNNTDGVIVVCDACSMERNLNLLLQVCELSDNIVLALNFVDDARKKGIIIDIKKLQNILGIPVVAINARKKRGIDELVLSTEDNIEKNPFKVDYGSNIEHALRTLSKQIDKLGISTNSRYLSLRLIEDDENALKYIENNCKNKIQYNKILSDKFAAQNYLYDCGMTSLDLRDIISISVVRTAHSICSRTVTRDAKKISSLSRADKILTGKVTGIAVMFAMLMLIFYLTLSGANYPSRLLNSGFVFLEKRLISLFKAVHIPRSITELIVFGGYRVLSWVVAVMLPPMAIFFPLFSILEDVGYLPRIAFNLDKCFKKCKACGKQALTTCMGFGCNAAAVTSARIIDSPREKLIAILTNAFIPCNGRFPALISIISIFLVGMSKLSSLLASMYLTFVIVGAILVSLLASKFLSSTLLRGMPTSFAIELPPYRKPQFGQILIRSVLDRTIFVLARAAAVAFPTGIIIYILCNTDIAGTPIINYICNFLDPLGSLMGMDGVMLTAFILAIPANEIVLPLALMIYSSNTVISDISSISLIHDILTANGWTAATAVCVVIFFVMHWPCSTTLMTVKKETKSLKWTFVSFALPTIAGIICCTALNLIFKLISYL